MMEMRTAKAWHLTPEQWRLQSGDDRARMLAHEMLEGAREAWVAEELKRRHRNETANGAPRKPNPFEAMKLQQMDAMRKAAGMT